MARCCHETSASATEVIALKICETRMIRLRLNRSAKCPAGNESATTGIAMTRPTRPERGRRMRAPINFPLDRDRQHLPADDREQIADGKQTEPAESKRSIRIVRLDFRRDRRTIAGR